MKPTFLLFLVISASCVADLNKPKGSQVMLVTDTIADARLSRAIELKRDIFANMYKVESGSMSRADFEKIAKPAKATVDSLVALLPSVYSRRFELFEKNEFDRMIDQLMLNQTN